MKQDWSKETQFLLELRRKQGPNSKAFKKGILDLESKVFSELCSKPYQKKCDSAYCVCRLTDTCEFLPVWNKIRSKLKLSQE